MSIAILSLLTLVVIIVVCSIRTDLNASVMAIAFAYVIGVQLDASITGVLYLNAFESRRETFIGP